MSIKKDITPIVEQHLCHSCGSCFAACGHDCIEYKNTTGGYYFPVIDYNKCTECTLCYQVCPGDHFLDTLKEKTVEDPFVGNVISIKVGKATNKQLYQNSQSGGVTTAILKYLLETKQIEAAIVTTMDMNSDSYTKAKLVNTVDELIKAQKSKYIPTTINELMPEVLKIDGPIAMVGLSCHFHGLENLMKINKKLKKKKIIRIGLICDKVQTNRVVDFFTNKHEIKSIKEFTFRDKTTTNYPGEITYKDCNNTSNIIDKKHRMIMKDFFTPVRCLLCFDKMNIYSDIVVGDPHGLEGIDRKNGESLVLTRTELGESILKNTINSLEVSLKEAPLEESIEGQSIAKKRKKWNANTKAWIELGYDLPDYPNSVHEFSTEASKQDVINAKQQIIHSLSLDKYNSKNDLLKDAKIYHKKYLIKYKFITCMTLPYKAVLRVHKKFKGIK